VLSVGWTILAVAVAVLLTAWITFTATRLDRLHARLDAAQAALDAQLVRRAAALQHIADCASPATGAHLSAIAHAALEADDASKETAENAVSRAVDEVVDLSPTLPPEAAAALPELAESATRVVIARRFYNDAVRDTRTLRNARMPRLLRLAGHREYPQFFNIDDSTRLS
jgi:hypothetical protein